MSAHTIVGNSAAFTRLVVLVAGGVGASIAVPALGSVYNAASDFSATSNPNGVWSFGQTSPAPGSAFTLFAGNGNAVGLDYWGSSVGPILPAVLHNPTGSTNVSWGTAEVDPGQLVLHPGAIGEYAVVRFTVATAGIYTFNADFIGQDNVIGTSTDVHLLLNTGTLFSGYVAGYHATVPSGTFVMSLVPGDTIDAAVGFGGNGFFGDTTGLDFNVSFVPAPGAGALLGVAGLLASRRRR